MAEYDLMNESEIAEGSSRLVTLNAREIGIFKAKGKIYAYRNVCPHDGGPVCTGTITGSLAQGPQTGWKLKWDREGEILYCPWHGSDFDICTGEALSRKPLRLESFPVKMEGGRIKITL